MDACVKLAAAAPEAVAEAIENFDVILVDETQDMSDAMDVMVKGGLRHSRKAGAYVHDRHQVASCLASSFSYAFCAAMA